MLSDIISLFLRQYIYNFSVVNCVKNMQHNVEVHVFIFVKKEPF